ncbi:MAG: ATP-grasp domain-containing protein [Chloroflexota bacterium]|nr:ATP-grasp domain-containing protein [Chloroflexota bacterium]
MNIHRHDASLPPAIAPIGRLLVANRGELVVRIARTCRRLGIACLALVAADQARAWWTSAAHELVPLDGTYLDREAVLDAAVRAGADAIHPGYGFLAENADFADAVAARGLIWVGPPGAAMRALGDKQQARRLAAAVGVPVVPGYDGEAQSDAALREAAATVGYPLLVKPSAGGGGKGMHVVRAPGELDEAVATARREAGNAFGDERLVLERYLGQARHVEVQLLCDARGGAVHLGERECSLQRRHQKVIEEAPSSAVGERLRHELGEATLRLARAAGYVGAGTAEFLLGQDAQFYFLELNARLQVEHPVTELVTGRDLVADQLRIAAGEPLGIDQRDVRLGGHAIEARLYAEDPWQGFLPSTGDVVDVRWPVDAEGLRIDAGVGDGDVVGTRYDPLLAKLIAHGADRTAALARLRAALAEAAVLGVTTNRAFLLWLLARPEVARADLDTELIDRLWQPDRPGVPEAAWSTAAAALARAAGDGHRVGFRLNQPPALSVELDGEVRRVSVEQPFDSLPHAVLDDGSVVLDADGRALTARLLPAPTVEAALRQAGHAGGAVNVVTAPMPGAVLAIRAAAGEDVSAGQVLLVLEAMKMENNVTAPAAASVARVLVEPGQQVQRGEPLIELA